MRVALWTPSPEAAWVAALSDSLGLELLLVSREPPEAPSAEIDLYHVAGSPAHGFVYRALRRRPGIVLLAEWGLHALVHAETAGRGDAAAYRREARRAHGERGSFVARQVLAGLGGALVTLVAMNQAVLDVSLALVVFEEARLQSATALLRGRRAIHLPLDRPGEPEELRARAGALRALVLELAPRAEAERRARLAGRALDGSILGSALDELRWSARELGLAEPPPGSEALVAALLGSRP